LTQDELAQQVGCTVATIRKIEADIRRPSKQLAQNLAAALRVPPDELASFVEFARSEPYLDMASPPAELADSSPWKLLDTGNRPRAPSPLLLAQPSQVDWGEAPDVNRFYGRQEELAEINQWLVEERCRLIAVLGMGGIGKTALAAKLALYVQDQFEYILWRSLREAPPLEEILGQCIRHISNHQAHELPESIEGQISLLIHQLRQHRCLLVLDNAEAILRTGQQAGTYRAGYEGYGRLLLQVGESRHQSCLVVTSREKPGEFAALEGENSPVRSLQLTSLGSAEGRALLMDKGLSGSDESWLALSAKYSGNPLALKVVSETIRELFGGDIGAFLRAETGLFGGIRDLLAQQFARLSALEQVVMHWLAVEREPVGIDVLCDEIVPPVSKPQVLEALHSLRWRSLVETGAAGFTLQNVVMEYATESLVDQVCQEVITGEIARFQTHALLKAQAKAYVRESQVRLLLKPTADRLLAVLGTEESRQRLFEIVQGLRTVQPRQPGYAGGNALNLLVNLKTDLRGQDFSRLTIWQAHLRGLDLSDVNFCQANLAGCVFTEAFGLIASVTFSPGGEHVAAGTFDGEIHVWRAADGQPLLTCVGHTGTVWSVSFSPDGAILASGSDDQTVRLWNMRAFESGRCLHTLQGHTGRVWSVSFNNDGSILASGSDDQTIRLWDVRSNQCLSILHGHTNRARSVCFNSAGDILASGSYDQTIRLWDVPSGQCVNAWQGHTNWILSICFSPDGSILASGSYDNTVRLWDVSSGRCVQTLTGHTDHVTSVHFSPDGSTLASGSHDHSVRIWDVQSGQCLRTLDEHTNWVWSVCFSPDGNTLASGSLDQSVRLWEVRRERSLHTLQGHTNAVWSLCFHPNSHTLAGANNDQAVRLWDVHSGRCIETLYGHTSAVTSVHFSPDGRILASSSLDQTVRLWNVMSPLDGGYCLATLRGHTGWIWSVCFSPDGRILASASHDQTVRLWDTQSGQCLQTLEGHTDWVWSVSFSPDGRILASGSDDKCVRLWDVESRQCRAVLQGHVATVRSVCFSPDGLTLASGGDDNSVRLWDVQSLLCVAVLEGNPNIFWPACFNSDGSILASGGHEHNVYLWDVSSGQCFARLRGHTQRIPSLCFNHDDSVLASASPDETIRIWDVRSGECLHILRSDQPYQRMNIAGVTGLTEAQIANLKALGAVERTGQ
jgi:WD40 repeat protein/transcriptional regulator with XRE-family HTH domain